MRIAFFGTAGFAVPILESLIASEHEVVGVVTGPDKPVGRRRVLTPTVVKQRALDEGLPVLTPEKLKAQTFLADFAAWQPDAAVVVAYRILPREVFDLPPLGTLNIHPSLLPKYRGPAPLNWAIIEGETETGVSVIRITERVDAGGVVLQRRFPLGPDETSEELGERASRIGGEMILEALDGLAAGTLQPLIQDESLVTRAPKLDRDSGLIDWKMTASEVHNLVRGVQPWPGAYTHLQGRAMKIAGTTLGPREVARQPGEVLDSTAKGIVVACGKGAVRFTRLQLEGKKWMQVSDFLLGYNLKPGTILGDA